MSPLATIPTELNINDYLENIPTEQKKQDAKIILDLMKKVSGEKPVIWGNNFIVGFGSYKYYRKGGKEELKWFPLGFAARKTKLTLYLTNSLKMQEKNLEKLGKYKMGSGCLYINKLADVDLNILEDMITVCWENRIK